jgi:hypothetical protein
MEVSMPDKKVHNIAAGEKVLYEVYEESGWIIFKSKEEPNNEFRMLKGVEKSLINILEKIASGK